MRIVEKLKKNVPILSKRNMHKIRRKEDLFSKRWLKVTLTVIQHTANNEETCLVSRVEAKALIQSAGLKDNFKFDITILKKVNKYQMLYTYFSHVEAVRRQSRYSIEVVQNFVPMDGQRLNQNCSLLRGIGKVKNTLKAR